MRARSWNLSLAGLLLFALGAAAQTDAGNGVARVSFISGDVTVQRGDSGDLTEAAINAPLVTGDKMLTGPGSRSELQFDYANFIRLAPSTEVRMQELRPNRYLLAVAEGTASFSVVDNSDAEVEVNTPSISMRPTRRGNYRISVYPDGTTEITVRDGQAEVFSPSGVERLGEGRTILVRGDANNPEFQFVAESRRDEFDEWNRDRDRLIRKSVSYQYVDRSIPGAYDLDAYGGWVNVAPYGYVWRPRVAAGWAPYRNGRWAWVDYWGWNWIGYEPWGWAPYHYGRWFHSPGYGWCWWPGGRVRHFYSPAVVGFVGFNVGNFSFGFGFGNVGWVPLAPYEPFHRWWGGGWNNWYRGGWRSNRVFVDNSVNIVNNVNVTNIYRNARVNNGLTVVNGGDFRRGASVNPVQVAGDSIRSANIVRGRLPMSPDRGSLQYTNRSVDRTQIASRLSRTENRRFYSRTEPSRIERANFETQQRAMRQVQEQAFGRGGSANGAVSRNAGAEAGGRGATVGRGSDAGRGGDSVASRSGATAGRNANSGFTRQGDSGETSLGRGAGNVNTSRGRSADGGIATVPQRGQSMAQGEDGSQRGGWRRFGEPVSREGSQTRGGSQVGVTRGGSNDASSRGSETGATSSRGSSQSNSGWRRFGSPIESNGADRGSSRGTSSSRGSADSGSNRNSGVTRSEDSFSRGRGNSAPDASSRSSDSSWRSFGRGGSDSNVGSDSRSSRGSDTFSRGSSRSVEPSQSRGSSSSGRTADAFSRGSDSSSSRNSAPSMGRGSSGSSQERVRVSPSIVRERGGGSSGGSSGATSRGGGDRGSSTRGTSSGRGNSNRSSVDSSNWRRFEGGAASGIQAYGEPSSRDGNSQATSSRWSRSSDAFSTRSASSSRSPSRSSSGYTRASGSSSLGSSSRSRTADAFSSRGSSSRGSYSPPSSSVYSGRSSRSSSPSYRAPSSSRSSGPSYRAPSSSRSSGPSYRAPSYSRSGGGSFGGSISRGSSSRGGGASMSRGGGGSISRGGGSVGRSSGGGSRGGGGRGRN